MSEEEKQYLTEEELQEITKLGVWEAEKKHFSSDTLTRMKNTIEKLEAEFKSVKELKSFIGTGVLVNPNLILSAEPSERGFDLGMKLTALGSGRFGEEAGYIIHVNLRVPDVERLIKMLPEMLKAARLKRDFSKLKDIHKEKTKSRYGRRY